MTLVASAPGKLMLLGEYAVLGDAPALVAAISRRAEGRRGGGSMPNSAVLRAVADLAQDDSLRELDIDSKAFLGANGEKLGLGSSAATAVVASALALGKGDEQTLSLAIRAHRMAQGGKGSGVDVASAFYGGVIAAKRQPGSVEPLASSFPGLRLFALWTGSAASTPELVSRIESSPGFSDYVRQLGALSDEGIRAWQKRDASRFLSVVSRYGRAMQRLGKDCDAPVVTEVIEAIMRLSGEAGGAAKPSGAGGGDVVVVFGRDPDLGQSLAAQTEAILLDLEIERSGLVLRDQKR